MDSRDSRIYPGIKRLDNEVTRRGDPFGNRIGASEPEQSIAAPYIRTVRVYVPAQHGSKTAAPLMVVQDGHLYLNKLPCVLDNLIAAKRAPPLIAILIDSGGGDAQGSERGLEYDTLSGRYSDFIETEVLPQVIKQTAVNLTNDPHGRASMGVGSGAACAFTMAWFHPEKYRRVLSYSGAYVNQQSPPNPHSPRGGWEYHASLIPQAEHKPLRIWLEVGEKDLHHDDPETSWHNWPLATQRMAAALAAKGYAHRLTYSLGGGHADIRVLSHTLPSALEWLWADYAG